MMLRRFESITAAGWLIGCAVAGVFAFLSCLVPELTSIYDCATVAAALSFCGWVVAATKRGA